ncbi:exodeoxyribonuclease VII large subunit [Paenibacillus sp. GYB006]|uniref:exodeoxyribonuclease VII large subunit n=1 Tax=Paenibacillus sp. GYB006 TaxID=2994394 RepID=UPI002F965017
MAEQRIYSIKDINRYIRMKMDSDNLLSSVWIRGEISNFTHHSSGHMYFTLKDEGSRIKSIMFATHNRRLPFIPKEGARVIAQGNITVFERDGQYQFYATQMQPDGIGSLYLAYEQLKKKLEQEGLFAAQRKRPLPRYPKTIGVITSPTGAAVRDIITTITRRYPLAEVILYPVVVQGKTAAPSIVRALRAVNQMAEADVVIVGRGGGSLEELWAFNEEIVARAITESEIPVISAVGHETDFTIADFAADVRAATPTAAAELAVPHQMDLKDQVDVMKRRLKQSLMMRAKHGRERLNQLSRSSVLVNPSRSLIQHTERLDQLTMRLSRSTDSKLRFAREKQERMKISLSRFNPSDQVAAAQKQVVQNRRQLEAAMRIQIKETRQKLGSSLRHLDALSPLKVMSRGYSLVYNEDEKQLVKSTNDVLPGDVIKIKLSDGGLSCEVREIKEDDKDDK